MGANLGTVAEESSFEFTDSVGMNLLNGFSIFPHFEKSQAQLVKDLALKKGLNILAIPEDSGVILQKDTMTFVGDVLKIMSNE